MFNATDPSLEYEPAWPRELFVAEATALLATPTPRWIEDAELLLEEAFTRDAAKKDLRKVEWYELPRALFDVPQLASAEDVARGFLTHLVNFAHKLPEVTERGPYWSARNDVLTADPEPTANQQSGKASIAEQLKRDWAELVEDLHDRGYLDSVAPRGCPAEPAPMPVADVLAAEMKERLRLDGLWPLRYEDWDDDTFYSLIEVVRT